MTPSRSEFWHLRGLRHHVRHWGPDDGPTLVLLHGWMDVAASFQFVVDALDPRWHVVAPDFRGFGHSGWAPGGYWFPDYVADLDALLQRLCPQRPLRIVGHSMGAQVASLYAGLRPQQVAELVILDGLFLPDMEPELAPMRFARWLDELREPPAPRRYPDFEDLARRIARRHPRLGMDRARFIARCWGREDGHGRIELCADPAHRRHGPLLYRAAESQAIWRRITARTLFVDGGASELARAIPPEEVAARRACFADHQSTVIPDAGHMLHFDAPETVARAIDSFLTLPG